MLRRERSKLEHHSSKLQVSVKCCKASARNPTAAYGEFKIERKFGRSAPITHS